MKILIVDDVPQVVELIRQTLLRVQGMASSFDDIRQAHSVTEARLELLRYRPDLILLDEVLPGESPIDLLQDPAFSGIPVIFVSAVPRSGMDAWKERFPQVLGHLVKWNWGDLERVAGMIRALVSQKP
jgi:hypothetical protein